LKDHKFLLYGAGSANVGIGNLIALAMQQEDAASNPHGHTDLTFQQALERIWMVDSKGLIVSSRTDLTVEKKPFAKSFESIRSLEEIVHRLKPTALIGATAQPNTFTEQVIRAMAEYNDFPIIFALSNPTSKAECTAQQAYEWSSGRALFASGSPFPPVEYKGRIHVPGQGNNSYIFPGVALAITSLQARRVTDQMFLIAAQTLSRLVDEDQLAKGCLYPPLKDIRSVSAQIAANVAEEIYRANLATLQPKPDDLLEFMTNQMYNFEYDDYAPPQHPVSSS
jgi:malate dehydrogenase (oxaloacetate-decarboxylating)(NADP+)